MMRVLPLLLLCAAAGAAEVTQFRAEDFGQEWRATRDGAKLVAVHPATNGWTAAFEDRGGVSFAATNGVASPLEFDPATTGAVTRQGTNTELAFALQVGTNEVDFVLSQSGVNAGEEPALQQEIDRIVGPSSDRAMFYDIGDGCVAFDSYSLPPPLFQEHPFEVGHCVSNRFEIPVVASFASNLTERLLFCESHSNEVAAAESFRMALSQAFSETNGIDFIATNFVSKKIGSTSISLDAATNIWTSWRSWTSSPIPRSSFLQRDVGPGGTNCLWAFIPMQTSSSVFWLPIIYVDDHWNISMWDYEEQGYSWE